MRDKLISSLISGSGIPVTSYGIIGVVGGNGGTTGCSNFPDSLGTDGNGAVSGATINTDEEKLGDGCLSFNGTNNLVNINGTVAFSSTVGSISIWIYASSSQSDRCVLSFNDTNANESLMIRVDGDSVFVRMRTVGGLQWEAKQTGLGTDEWHLITLVQDGSAVKYYFDNTEQGTFIDSTDKSKWITANMDNARIGCSNSAGDGEGEFFNGLTDDIGLFNIAIDEDTRDFIWNEGNGAKISSLECCEGVKAYYNCDELDNSTLTNNGVPVE